MRTLKEIYNTVKLQYENVLCPGTIAEIAMQDVIEEFGEEILENIQCGMTLQELGSWIDNKINNLQ